MWLFRISFSSYIFRYFDSDAYQEFIATVQGNLNLNYEEHQNALLHWLNRWRCRIPENDFPQLRQNIHQWYQDNQVLLPHEGILQFEDAQLDCAANAYESLKAIVVNHRRLLGSTAAAKILFALRPHSLLPWDNDISEQFHQSYREYLSEAKMAIGELQNECQQQGFALEDLPRRLGREQITIPKLVDEYYWITITNGFELPDRAQLEQWLNWLPN